MKVRTIENMVVIGLDVTVANLRKVEKFSPDIMTLRDDEGAPVFLLIVEDCEHCVHDCEDSIDDLGAKFTVSNDKALLWVKIPEEAAKNKQSKKEYVLDKWGIAISHIQEIEKNIADAIEGVNAKIAAIEENIEDLA